jgi:hypothetical protein
MESNARRLLRRFRRQLLAPARFVHRDLFSPFQISWAQRILGHAFGRIVHPLRKCRIKPVNSSLRIGQHVVRDRFDGALPDGNLPQLLAQLIQ